MTVYLVLSIVGFSMSGLALILTCFLFFRLRMPEVFREILNRGEAETSVRTMREIRTLYEKKQNEEKVWDTDLEETELM